MMFDFLLVFNLVVVVLYSLLFGSFLGVVIDRSISGDQFFKGRSVCDHCKHLLNPIDLIPLFSFLKTKGNCRYCGAKISKWLLVYELGTLVFNLLIYFFVIYWFALGGIESTFVFVFANVLWAIFLSDARYMLVPDFFFYILVFVYLVYFAFYYLGFEFVLANTFLGDHLYRFYGFMAMLIFFGGIYFFSKGKAMGFADVMLSTILAYVAGFRYSIAMWILSFYFGTIFAICLMAFKKKTFKGQIPFGPFIILGFFATFILGNALLRIYGI